MPGTNPKKVKRDIQQDLAGSTSGQFTNQAAGGFSSAVSGTNARQVQNEIQQDLSGASNSVGSSGSAMTNSLGGTNAQKVKKDIQQDLTQG